MDPATDVRDLRHHDADPARARCLHATQVAAFNRDGVLAPLPLLDADELAAQRATFAALLAAAAGAGIDSYGINGWHDRCAALWDLATDARLLDRVQDLLGEDIVCWGSHYFAKLPGDGRAVSWHQDAPYWPLTPSRTVTAWIAIDDADAANGAMTVVPGSHRFGALRHRDSAPDERNVLWLTLDDPRLAQCAAPHAVELRAGEHSLHSDLLVHGSPPNRSPRRRCGLTLRYAAATVRPLRPMRAIHCRGRDALGHWQPVTRPAG